MHPFKDKSKYLNKKYLKKLCPFRIQNDLKSQFRIQNDLKIGWSDPDLKKIISDPQHWDKTHKSLFFKSW